MDLETDERVAVVAAARAWLGTRWKHRSAVKGAGIDCAHLLVEAHVGAGLIARFDPGYYPNDWHEHRDEERFLAALNAYATDIGDDEAPICERGPDFQVLPGNVLIWRHGRTFSHGAIVSLWPDVIHASFPARCCLEESCLGGLLERKPMRVFSYWGH